jgi:hypothetical protein
MNVYYRKGTFGYRDRHVHKENTVKIAEETGMLHLQPTNTTR